MGASGDQDGVREAADIRLNCRSWEEICESVIPAVTSTSARRRSERLCRPIVGSANFRHVKMQSTIQTCNWPVARLWIRTLITYLP